MRDTRIIKSIEDIRDLESKVENKRFQELGPYFSFFFRGHEKTDYVLIPTISRRIQDLQKLETVENFIIDNVSEFAESHKNDKDLRIYNLSDNFHTKWQLLMQAQHLEIPSRFLDVTISIYHAALFAVLKPEYDSFDGELIVFYCPIDLIYKDVRTMNDYNFCKLDPFNLSKTIFINAGNFSEHIMQKVLAENRRSRQFGRFIAQPTEALIKPLEQTVKGNILIEKVLIPKEYKNKLRSDLYKMNIRFETVLFRDTDSINNLKIRIDKFIEEINA